MYPVPSGPGGRYVSAAESKRDGDSTYIIYTYLGTVIDSERGIYKNTERGFFTFDFSTGKFGDVPDDFVAPATVKTKGHRQVLVDFGDVFILNTFLHNSGLMDVVDQLDYGNHDTLHAMLLFYILSDMANADAIHWYEGNIVQKIYPNANLKSQRISEFLAAIGDPEQQMRFQQAYISFVMSHFSPDKNILIDSTGLPNSIHFPLTQINVHNGKVSNEIRLIFVVQRKTGLPLFYWAVPGNIVDMSTLERVFLHLDSLGIDIDSCIMDAGYNTAENLDLFYTEDHQCKIDYITRVKSNDKQFKKMINEEASTIEQRDNFVIFEGRYLFIVKRPVMVGKDLNNPAWMYLGLDCNRLSDEMHKLFQRAEKKHLPQDVVFEAMQTEGLFGVISGKEYSCEEILPAYYQRQSTEQIFDLAKNYTKLLPVRTNNEETFCGHLLLSYIASCAVKMIQMKLKTADIFLGSRLKCLRNQKCTIYDNRVVTDTPQRIVNETYQALGIICPKSIAVVDGKMNYDPSSFAVKEKSASKKKNSATAKKAASTKGNKEKPKAEAEAEAEPKKRGRPKGSKNKKTLEREAQEALQPKRGRGRPKGSKNKKTLEREARLLAVKNKAAQTAN